jgi:hypothetical protein
MRYDFYQAPHPWGPWTAIRSYSDRFLSAGHMYGPSLCAKFQRAEGTDMHMTLFTAGCPFDDIPAGLYKAWTIPITVSTAPVVPSVIVPSGDARIVYKKSWTPSGDSRRTASANASADLPFRGSGIEVIADKRSGFGSIDILLDGALARTASLAVENLPGLGGVTVFRSKALRNGTHNIRIVSKTASPVVVDAFRVYGG